MTDVTQGNTASFTLAAGEQVYIKTAGAAVVKYGRLLPKSPSVVQLTSADSEVRYGPYPVEMLFEVSATTGTLTYSDSATVIQRLPDDGSDLSAKFNAVADALGSSTGGMTPAEIGGAVRLTVKSVDDVSALRTTEPFYDGQQIELLGHTTAGIGGGVFYYDAADTTTADDNGVTIVTAGGKRWKRKYDGNLNVTWFGILEDGITDNASAYSSMRASFPDSTVDWPEITGLGYATSAPFAMSSSSANIGSKSFTKVIGLGDNSIFEVNGGNCEISYFTFDTLGSRDSSSTVGVLLNGTLATSNFKTHLHHFRVGSEFNTLILTNVECDQSWFHDITSFKNHKRGTIDINTSGTASAPAGSVTIERVWVTPTGFDPEVTPPSLFGVRMGRSDSSTIRNCILNGCQNDILIDNSGTSAERNWTINICNTHFEHRYDGSSGVSAPDRWQPSTTVTAGDIVIPSRSSANGYAYKAQNSGTSGASEPVWPKNNVIGFEDSVVDNDVTWIPWYSAVAVRFIGSASSATEINSCQMDNHLVTILDVGNNISLKSVRQLGDAVDKAYMRTSNNGTNTVLSISQSSVGAGDFVTLEGSSVTWLDIDSSIFEAGATGIPSKVQRSSIVEGSRAIRDRYPTPISVSSGVSVDVAEIGMTTNSEISATIKVSLRVFDAGFVCRGAASIMLDVSALRVSGGNPVVSIVDTINDALTDSDTFSAVFSSSFASDVLTISCTGTHSRSGVTLRYYVNEVSVDSGTKSVQLL